MTDTGYITIRDATTDSVIVEPYSVDLKIPYLRVTNYKVLQNGYEFEYGYSNGIEIGLRNWSTSEAYYQYEKITDQNVINKYREIKSQNGDILELENILKTTTPTGNWSEWEYWNGVGPSGLGGVGYTETPVSVPDEGLYYMWVYFSGANLKDMYGYILVDNLGEETSGEQEQSTGNDNDGSNNGETNGQDGVKNVDETTANRILPKAGKTSMPIALLCVTIIITVILYMKNRKYKDIN